jgi:hypothetical protein
VVSYFWRLQKVALSLPFTPKSPQMKICSAASHCNGYRVRLPAEIWREIANWLTRPDLKSLLHVPHPLRKFASDLVFRDIFLQFDVYSSCSGDVQLNRRQEELQAWHSQRTLGIMTRILRDWRFAGRVRSLRVHMCDHRSGGPIDVINFELSESAAPSLAFQILLCLSPRLSCRSTLEIARAENPLSLWLPYISL